MIGIEQQQKQENKKKSKRLASTYKMTIWNNSSKHFANTANMIVKTSLCQQLARTTTERLCYSSCISQGIASRWVVRFLLNIECITNQLLNIVFGSLLQQAQKRLPPLRKINGVTNDGSLLHFSREITFLTKVKQSIWSQVFFARQIKDLSLPSMTN